MKRKGIKGLAFVAAAGLLATSCDLLKDVDYTVTPDPLEMHGDSVKVKVDIILPEKGINKKAYAEITPAIGTHALKPVTIVGEKATANGTVVPYKAGGTVVYEDIIAYSPDMEASELSVTGKIYKKDKLKGEIEKQKIADATVITPLLVDKDFRVIIASDKFERVTPEKQVAEINYLKGSPTVRSSELRDEDIVSLDSFLTVAQTNPKIEMTGINITAFASIEGEEDKNNTLSNNRAESAKEATMKIAKRRKVENEAAQDGENYSTVGKGEDFVGFKRALKDAEMDESDKKAIMTVLEMQKTPEAREQAIRDLSTYLYLDNNVFPAQRRSEIVVNYNLTGFSDEELKEYSKSNIDTLNLEEILFTATLTDDLNEKLRLYKEAERMFPDDYRPSNNVGSVLYMQNKLSEAKSHFEKANGIEENKISKNNLAAIAGVNGEREDAKSLLEEADGAGNEVSYNKGILNIQDGDYEDAISNFGSEATYNKGLAELLSGYGTDKVAEKAATALSTVDESEYAETAQGYYLKAVASSRQDKLDGIVSNLKSAFAKDASLKAKAAKDREFMKYMDNASFTAIVK
jgi:ethanolamine utilization cobalamin adenosyltransferase